MSTRKRANNEQSLDDNALVRPSPLRRAVAWITLIAYVGQPLAVTAEVIADQAAAPNNRPLVDVTANGLPLVQIAPPSAAGVSHNQYNQFNVGPEGVILNNGTGPSLTQQAGYVGANPNLVNGSARIILNEVTSTSRSQLNGYTEVAGQQAEVIIANPNGITCNGCGFINASRGVLTTGAPVMGVGGSLDYFRVTGGDIQIGSGGLNGSNTSQLDLITRSVQVNGELWANNLNVITGSNQVNYNTLGVQIIPGIGAQPTVGIDVALLGGMYANKIRLIGTEAGVGVNSQGDLYAQTGDFTLDNVGQITLAGNTTAGGNIAISSATGIANSGTLYSQQNATLTSTTGTITNSGNNAKLLSQGNLTLNAASVNSTGALGAGIDNIGNATQNGNLAIITSGQTTATGTNIAGGSMNIAASDINLANSNTTAWNNIDLNATAGNIDNTNGLIVNALNGGGNITLTVANGSLVNEGGRIGSDQDLIISANSMSGVGKAIAGNDASITLRSDYTNAVGNVYFANRNLTFSTSGNLSNQAALEAQQHLSVTAANITNDATGSFNAASTTLTATNAINNDGRIDGSLITVTSTDITNNASILGDLITINANNLINRGDSAIIGATTNIDLWITQQLSNLNGAEIYSMGNLNIAANDAMDVNGNYISLTQRILNEGSSLVKSSLIEADGNINIGVITLDNRRPQINPTDVVVSEITKRLTAPGRYVSCWAIFSTIPCTASGYALIQGGFFVQDMVGLDTGAQYFNVVGNDPISHLPTVYYESIGSTATQAAQYSGWATDFSGNYYYNTQVIKLSDIASRSYDMFGGYTVILKNGSIQTFTSLDKEGLYYDVNYYPGYNPNINIHPEDLLSTSTDKGTIYEQWRDVTIKTTDQVVDMSVVPKEAQIRATGNININLGATGTLTNYVSTIAAGNSITVSNNTTIAGEVSTTSALINTGLTLNQTVDTTGSSYLYGEFSCGFLGMVTCERGATLTVPPKSDRTALSTIPSSITAGKNFTVHADVVTNETIGGTQTSNPANSTTPGAITVPTSGLYTINPEPDQGYLVATDPRFTNYQQFISSDYMLERLTLDPLYTQKRLGDGFYEQKLINDQVAQLTGRRFIPPYANAQDEIKALMDAGLSAAKDLMLVPGMTLTKEQVAALTTDILWMVEESVAMPDGEMTKVLVPRVYLSSLHTADLKPNGALISADVIDINATGTLANSGGIRSNTAMMLAANDILNRSGTISSGGDLFAAAQNDIRNESGMIRGRNVQLNAGHDILNSTLTRTIRSGNASLGGSNTVILDAGTISSSNGLELSAANDITISGAKVESGGSATLNAGRNLTVATIVQEAIATSESSSFHYNTQQITNHTSSITTGGGLTLISGGDMHLTSAMLQAGKEATLMAGGDLTIDAAKDSFRKSQVYTGKDEFYSAEKSFDETVVGGTITAGGNINLIATRMNTAQEGGATPTVESGADATEGSEAPVKGNITLNSATITSKAGSVSIMADANVSIGITEELHEKSSELRSQSSGITTTTHRENRNETWRTDTVGSSITGDNIKIASGKDINIEGSKVEAERNIDVAAMGNLNILAATDTYGSESYSRERTTGLQASNAFSITDQGPDTIQRSRTEGSKQSQNRSSLVSKNGDLNLMAGGDLFVVGSDLAAGPQPEAVPERPHWGEEDGMAYIQMEPVNASRGNDGISKSEFLNGKGRERQGGQINLTAGGSIALLAGQDFESTSSEVLIVTNPNAFTKIRRTITDTSTDLTHQGSTVQGRGIKLSSGADILLQATDVQAGEKGIEIDAGQDLKLLAAVDQHSRTHQEKLATDGYTFRADGSLNDTDTRRMNNKFESQTSVNQVTRLTSKGDIKTHSGRDTLIEASTLEAQGAIDLSAGTEATYNEDGTIKTEAVKGNITFAAVKDSNYYSVEDSQNSMPWQSSTGHGEMKETLKLANIKAGKGLSVDASGEIIVDIPEVPAEAPAPVEPEVVEVEEPMPTHGADGKPLSQKELDAIAAERAAKAAAKAAEKAEKAAKAAEEKRQRDEQRFNDHITTLAGKSGQEWIGQLAKMAKDKPDSVKLRQVNAAMQHWDYAHEGLTGEASAVIAIVVTYFTAGAGSSAVGAATSTSAATAASTYVVTTAVVQAAITTLATQATLALINNKGNVGKTLDDMGKSENVKALVTSMITAGVLAGLNQNFNFGKDSAGKALTAKSDFMDVLKKNVINNTASTIVNHAMYGGDLQQQLEQSLKNALIDTGAAKAANWIGDKKQDKTFNNVTHKLAHAIAGCAMGAAKANDCSSGALGAVVGEITAELYSPDSTAGMTQEQIAEMKTNTINFSKLMAGVAAALTGGDAAAINLASAAGGNAAENNCLLHPKEIEWINKNAKKYAEDNGIPLEQAKTELAQQAARNADATAATLLGATPNERAQAFLNEAQTQGYYINEKGEQQALFTSKTGDYTNGLMNAHEVMADKDSRDFYKQYIQPTASSSNKYYGMYELVQVQGAAMPGAFKDGIIALADGMKSHPLDTLWSMGVGAWDGLTSAGNSFGASLALASDDSTQNLLDSLYGRSDAHQLAAFYAALPAAAAVGGGAIGGVAAKGAVRGAGKLTDAAGNKLDDALTKAGQDGLLDNAGAIDPKTGKPVLNLSDLAKQTNSRTDLKEATGEFFGNNTVKQILPEGKYLGGSTGTGKTGLDGIYKIDNPDVDYVIIENKYVGDPKNPERMADTGADRLGKTDDGRQGSENWTLGSDRIENAVGRETAPSVKDAIRNGRTETWVVTTRPDGSTEIQILDPSGRPKAIETSRVLNAGTNLTGVRP